MELHHAVLAKKGLFGTKKKLMTRQYQVYELGSFAITISESILENLKRLPFEFDFSILNNIWTEMHQVDCFF